MHDLAMSLNTEATRWQRVYVDIGLLFRSHINLMLENPEIFEERVRYLIATKNLVSGPVRKFKVAAVQAVALYGPEL